MQNFQPAHFSVPNDRGISDTLQANFDLSTFSILRSQQWEVQVGALIGRPKERARTLADWQTILHPHRAPAFDCQPRRISEYLNSFCKSSGDATLVDIISTIARRNGSTKVVDLMGGLSVWMREAMRLSDCTHHPVKMTSVDLFDWSQAGAETAIQNLRIKLGDDIMDRRYQPQLVIADVNQRLFDHQNAPDLTVVLEGMQYLTDKLQALTTWYNQSADNGLLLIAGSNWPEWISSENSGQHPFEAFADTLLAAGITVVSQGAYCQLDGLSGKLQEKPFQDPDLVLLRKEPGTNLIFNGEISRTFTNDKGYIRSFYCKPKDFPFLSVAAV